MCGIAGFLAENQDLQASTKLEAMLGSIVHRGPDEWGQWIDGPLAMGMRRLSIIDLADGSQPLFDESGRFGIVFNGEICNYRELREQLSSRGHRLKTKSDTETIVHLYEELGPECVHLLRGMFGFAIWDSREPEYLEELQELLEETIALHWRSDVPFGAFLSGGLDSSTIVAMMSQQQPSPVKTFSVGFNGPGLQDELPYAAKVAAALGCEHHILTIGSQDFLDLAENVLWHLDQPIADQATIATHMVAKLARQHVNVGLTGEGSDELFAGYARYTGERFSSYTSWLPSSIGHSVRSILRRLPGLRRAKIAINALTMSSEAKRFSNWFPMFNDDSKRHLFASPFHHLGQGADDVFEDHLTRCDAQEPLNRMLYVDSKLWLV